jgi:hypothetical protein
MQFWPAKVVTPVAKSGRGGGERRVVEHDHRSLAAELRPGSSIFSV